MRDRSAARYVCYIIAAVLLASLIPLRIAELDSPLIQLAAVIIASALIYTGGVIRCASCADPVSVMREHIAAIFVLYILLLVNFTIFDGHFGRVPAEETASVPLSEYFRQRGNIVPFRMIYRQTKALIAGNYLPKYFIMNVIGNLAAFAPFALFLPLLFKWCRRTGAFFAVMTAVIFSVETCQLLTRVGSFDVDDYILNMLGALVLFILLATKRGEKIKKRILDPLNKNTKNRSENEKNNSL